jgi:hypothetical protein
MGHDAGIEEEEDSGGWFGGKGDVLVAAGWDEAWPIVRVVVVELKRNKIRF